MSPESVRFIAAFLFTHSVRLISYAYLLPILLGPLPPLPLSLSLREIAAYSPRLVCSRPTAIASLAAHTTASTIPPLSLSLFLSRTLTRSLAPAATRDQRQEALSVEEGTTFVRSVRPSVRPFKSHGRTERDSLAPSVPHFLRPPGMKRQKNNK